MRKLNKIISLVLVMAMLLSMLAILPVGASATDEGAPEPFVPSADYADFTATDSARADATNSGLGLAATTEGNILNKVFQANWNDNVMTSWVVTDKSNNDNKYLSIVAEAEKANNGHYIAFFAYKSPDIAKQRENLIFAATDNGKSSGYYVIDFDFATESDFLTNFYVSPNITTSDTGIDTWRNRLDPDTTSTDYRFGKYSDKADGKWHHYTMVGDLAANALYVFIDGKIIGRICDAYKKPAKDSTAIDSNNLDYCKSDYYVNGLRIETKNGWGLGTGNSLNIDNVSVRSFNAEDGASLATAIANKSLSNWEHNVTASGSLPAVATVDGTEKSSIKDLVKALEPGYRTSEVVLLREVKNNITVTVGRNAVVETNGLVHKLVAKEGVTYDVVGTKITYNGPFVKIADINDITNNDGIKAAISGNASGNIGYNINSNDITAAGAASVTNNATDDTYFRFIAQRKNSYIDIKDNGKNAYSDGEYTKIVYDSGKNQYMVYDFDFAYLYGGTTFPISSVTKKSDGNSTWGTSVNAFGSVTAKWQPAEFRHVTVVLDFNNNKLTLYVDNVDAVAVASNLSGTVMDATYHKTWKSGAVNSYVKHHALRIGGGSTLDQSYALANVGVRYISYDNGADTLAAAISAKDLTGWDEAVYKDGYVFPECAPIALVNGEYVYSDAQLSEKLGFHGHNKVELLCDVKEAVTVGSSATVKTNGCENSITAAPGYNMSEVGDNTIVVESDKRLGKLVVNYNGEAIIKAYLPYGTDIAEYLRVNHAYNFDVIATDNGKLYTGVVFETAPTGAVNNDTMTYNITSATEYSGKFLVLNGTDGTKVTSYAAVKNALNANLAYEKIIILNEDVEIDQAGLELKGINTVHMLGHTISFKAAPNNHAFVLQGAARDTTFIGGALRDDVRNNTHSIFFTSADFDYEIKLVNCDIFAVATIATLRGGAFTAEGCNITVNECQAKPAFELGAFYNANYSFNKLSFNLIDSKINLTHYTGKNTQSFIGFIDYSVWLSPVAAAQLASFVRGSDKLVHEINIFGCEIAASFNTGLITTGSKPTSVNCDLTIGSTQLNVNKLYDGNVIAKDFITIADNVNSAKPITDGGVVKYSEDVAQVNSGNPEAPYAYVKEYATVVWSNGTEELWAVGSYPVNSDCKTDKVEKITVAGARYEFTTAEGFAVKFKADLTLDATLKFNLYVPTNSGYNITAVSIGNEEYVFAEAEVVKVGGVECKLFVYELAPNLAAEVFTIKLTINDEYTVSRNMSVLEYANRLEASGYGKAENLVKALLQYIADAHEYTGTYIEGYEGVNKFADAADLEYPTSGIDTLHEKLSAYISSVQLNLSSAPKWRFNLVASAGTTSITVEVDGKEVGQTEGNGYIEVALPAYDMLKTVTVTVTIDGVGVSGDYNFAAYYVAQQTLASAYPLTGKVEGKISNALAYQSMDLLKSFYTYAYYAAAYKTNHNA